MNHALEDVLEEIDECTKLKGTDVLVYQTIHCLVLEISCL
jgi:hypothetical protein